MLAKYEVLENISDSAWWQSMNDWGTFLTVHAS
jgi:hypothetical protein